MKPEDEAKLRAQWERMGVTEARAELLRGEKEVPEEHRRLLHGWLSEKDRIQDGFRKVQAASASSAADAAERAAAAAERANSRANAAIVIAILSMVIATAAGIGVWIAHFGASWSGRF